MVSMGKGGIAFALDTVPTRLYAARGPRCQLSPGASARWRANPLPQGLRARRHRGTLKRDRNGRATSSGRDIVLTNRAFDSLPVPDAREIAVSSSVPNDQVDPICSDQSHYVEPEAVALKPYTILREVLVRCGRTVAVRVALRQRARVAVLWVCGNVVLLQTLHWRDEIRDTQSDLPKTPVPLEPRALKLAGSLVYALTSDFVLSDNDDTYRYALLTLLDAKSLQAWKLTAPASDVSFEGNNVVDLMSALQARLSRAKPETNRQSRSGTRRRKAANSA